MKTAVVISTLLFATLAQCQTALAQAEAAVPFLLFSPSSEANGMAGTSIALPRFDPTASVFSPAQVGISALTTNVRGSFYPTDAQLPVAYQFPGFSYTAWAASAGVLLNDFMDLPLRVGVGLGYHRVDEDLGTFVITTPGNPAGIGTFESHENASGVVIGIGIEYLVRFGFGYTFRSVESRLSAVGTEQGQGDGEASGTTGDYSFLLEVPLVSIAEEIAGDRILSSGKFRPFLDLGGGCGWNNVGDKLVYIDEAQADPFPRTARTGIALSGGVSMGRNADWEILSAAWSREAEDILVDRNENGQWEYQSGFGDIQFGNNVIQGKKTANVSLRSGWQVQVGEIFTYRSGSVKTYIDYETRGYTIQLAGILKGISELLQGTPPAWLEFARDHIDIQYHSAEYEQQSSGKELTTYSGITVSLHTWPL